MRLQADTMDPLSSLSVASSAIQIFDFSAKLWKQIRDLHQSENGTTMAQRNILTDAARLHSLNSDLCKLLTPESLHRSPTATEESVVSLCNECGDAAEQLVDVIQQLTLDERSDVSGLRRIHHDNSRSRLIFEVSERRIDRVLNDFEEAEGHPSPRRPKA